MSAGQRAATREKTAVAVRVSGLGRGFTEGGRRRSVLERIDAVVHRGETVALRGRSGSGKSTLLNLISGIDAPDEGQIEVGGVLLNGLTDRERTLFRRRHVGFVYQAFNLVPTLTVLDNVCLMLELNGVTRSRARDRVEWLLAAVGLEGREKSWPESLSGGEQQRVAIARALAHRPALLLADEPTGNLDDATAQSVLDLLDTLVRKNGGTMIVATHSLQVAGRCDRVLELREGRLHGEGGII